MLPSHSLLIQDFTLSHKKALQQKALRVDQPVYSQPNLAITLSPPGGSKHKLHERADGQKGIASEIPSHIPQPVPGSPKHCKILTY